jgi:hypothetical protein
MKTNKELKTYKEVLEYLLKNHNCLCKGAKEMIKEILEELENK